MSTSPCAQGEVHALLGENGAGKSTMCSILSGLYRPDAGEMRLHGKLVDFKSPKDALAAGVGMVYQHFRLVANLTVAENLALGQPDLAVSLSQKELEEEARELGERYEFPVDPAARIWQLSVGQQQRVEILKLLYRDAKVLILDEPTAVLTPQESDALFRTMRLLADEGRSLIFVSHKLYEVKAVSDRVTVLRDGRVVGGVDTADAEPRDLARMMVGRDLELPTREAPEHVGDPVLSVHDVWVEDDRGLDAVRGVSLEVRSGEIVGIAGVSGNGQRELAYGIVGLRRPKQGQCGGVRRRSDHHQRSAPDPGGHRLRPAESARHGPGPRPDHRGQPDPEGFPQRAVLERPVPVAGADQDARRRPDRAVRHPRGAARVCPFDCFPAATSRRR